VSNLLVALAVVALVAVVAVVVDVLVAVDCCCCRPSLARLTTPDNAFDVLLLFVSESSSLFLFVEELDNDDCMD